MCVRVGDTVVDNSVEDVAAQAIDLESVGITPDRGFFRPRVRSALKVLVPCGGVLLWLLSAKSIDVYLVVVDFVVPIRRLFCVVGRIVRE